MGKWLAAFSENIQDSRDHSADVTDSKHKKYVTSVLSVPDECVETEILDKSDQLNRVLLPLYIVYKYFENYSGLTTGDVETVTDGLGVRVLMRNASKVFATGGSKYVTSDVVRKQGRATRYKLNRRGTRRFEELFR